MNKKQKYLDIKNKNSQQTTFGTCASESFRSTLFSRGKKSQHFFTEDSKLYITPKELSQMQSGTKLDRSVKKWDGLSSRVVRDFQKYQPSKTSLLLEVYEKHKAVLDEQVANVSDSITAHLSLARLWNLSIVGSVMFGMVLMTFVYRYLGQGAAADQTRLAATSAQTAQISSVDGKVLAGETEDDGEDFTKRVMEIEQISDQQALEKEIRSMVKGYPIEDMVPYIAKKDRTVAAFLIGIAKKESGWGEHHPVLNGQDCYNYWGYRGQRKLMGTGGHTCFNSPQDAVDTVAKRINTLVDQYGKTTPAKMVDTWKCGTSCEGDADSKKWISDVTMYFNKLNAD